MRFISLMLAITIAPLTLSAAPKVVATIPPIQGLLVDIMRGAGEPTLLLDGNVSPQNFAMRPAQANILAQADIVFAIGLGLDHWAGNTGGAAYYYLSDIDGLETVLRRQLEVFSAELDDPLAVLSDDQSDTENAILDAEDAEVEAFLNEIIGAGQDAVFDQQEGNDLTISSADPHFWLSPINAVKIVEFITQTLSAADLVNSEIYQDNARRLTTEILRKAGGLETGFRRLERIEFIVTHDSLQYFELEYDIQIVGTVSPGNGVMSGARSLSSLYANVGPNTCLLVDVSRPEGFGHNPYGEVPSVEFDPFGAALIGDYNYYPRLLDSLAKTLSNCVL